MTIAGEITKLQTNLANSYTAVSNKGGTLPVSQNFDNLPTAINSIQTGSFYATLSVTTNDGASVTVNDQTEIATGGIAVFYIYNAGTYNVVAELDGYTKTGSVTISNAEQYSITIFPKSDIPDEYQEVEYIQSNRTGYIDTGFQFTSNNAKVSLDVMLTASDSGGRNIFGSATNNDSSWFGIYMKGPLQAGFYCGNSNPFDFLFTRNVKKSVSFYRNGNSLTFTNDGSTSTYTVGGTIVCGNNLMIATQPPLGTSRVPPDVRYYNFVVEQDGSVVRNYKPVYRKADTVVGMYDTKNGVFYPPAEGTFGKGPDV